MPTRVCCRPGVPFLPPFNGGGSVTSLPIPKKEDVVRGFSLVPSSPSTGED